MLVVCREQRAVQAEARERETVITAKLQAVEEVKVGLKTLHKVEIAKLEVAEDAKIYRLNKIRQKCLRGTAQVEHFRDPIRGDVVWTCAGRDGG